MIVVKRGKEPNSLLKFRKQHLDADYETDMPTDVLKDIREQMWEEQKWQQKGILTRFECPGLIAGTSCQQQDRQQQSQ